MWKFVSVPVLVYKILNYIYLKKTVKHEKYKSKTLRRTRHFHQVIKKESHLQQAQNLSEISNHCNKLRNKMDSFYLLVLRQVLSNIFSS